MAPSSQSPRLPPKMDAEEIRLIRLSQQGDQVAFEELVRRHQPKVFSIIANVLRDRREVEDIAQQVFVKLYFSLPGFRFRSTLSTWLYRITVNECYDYLRKQRARPLTTAADLTEGDTQRLERLEDERAATGLSEAERLELKEFVTKLLQGLSPGERILLTLKELEGLSIEEIASVTAMNENTVKVKLFRARAKLAKALGGKRPG